MFFLWILAAGKSQFFPRFGKYFLFFFQSTFSKLVPLVDHSLRNRSLAMNLGYLGATGPSVAPKAASSGIPQLGSFQSGTIGGRLLGATATATTVCYPRPHQGIWESKEFPSKLMMAIRMIGRSLVAFWRTFQLRQYLRAATDGWP